MTRALGPDLTKPFSRDQSQRERADSRREAEYVVVFYASSSPFGCGTMT